MELWSSKMAIAGGVRWSKETERHLANPLCLEQYGYKVYSQNDEDGIIQEIFNRIGVTNKQFIEFGVQNGLESNGHYLLFQDWKGLWLEGDPDYVSEINRRFHPVLESGQLTCVCAFIDKDNINDLIRNAGVTGEIDLLSVDIDGNDYYIWEAIDVVSPRVVIIEYNGKFPPDCDWKMAYNAEHCWDGSDWHGASLKALELLGKRLGYQLVGTNLNGANAFFVRNDLAGDKFYTPACAEELYNPLRLDLTHTNGHPARYCLKNQTPEKGIFNYTPGVIARPQNGFHGLEGEYGSRYAWMSRTNSTIAIWNEESYETVRIPVFKVSGLEKNGEIIRAEIVTDGQSYPCFANGTDADVVEVRIDKNQELIKLEVKVSFLWKPCEILEQQDNRELGIAIEFDKIEGR